MYSLVDLSFLQWLAITLIATHITILGVTLYLHRGTAHRSIDFHPALVIFFRFWLWLTTGMNATEWTAVHRKHHAKCETNQDPHSPIQMGLSKVFIQGAILYRKEANNSDTIQRYSTGCPKDKLEAFFIKNTTLGILILLALELVLFGPFYGFLMWTVQMLWIPFWAAGVINGIGHYWGYRNHDCQDASRNICPWGIIIGGEELHNNHHAFPTSAKLSYKPWEFDWGWAVLKILSFLNLAKPLRVMPQITLLQESQLSIHTLQALIQMRFETLRNTRTNLTPWVKQQLKTIELPNGFSQRDFLKWYFSSPKYQPKRINDSMLNKFQHLLKSHPALEKGRTLIFELSAIWEQTSSNRQESFEALKAWCNNAESSGIEVFHNLSNRIQKYKIVST